MAKIEAFCTQCGSLILVDEQKEISNCIFCTSEIYTQEALELNDNPEKIGDIQKKYAEDPTPRFITPEEKRVVSTKADNSKKSGKKNKSKNKKGKDTSLVEQKPTKPEIKTQEIAVMRPLPKKTKLIVLAGFVAFALILTAIFVPLITSRNASRNAMDDRINQAISIQIEDHTFRYLDNRELWLLTEDEISEDIARSVFNEYVILYDSEYNAGADKIRDKLSVRVFAPEGTYLCEYIGSTLNCEFRTATPTSTPEPTIVIGD